MKVQLDSQYCFNSLFDRHCFLFLQHSFLDPCGQNENNTKHSWNLREKFRSWPNYDMAHFKKCTQYNKFLNRMEWTHSGRVITSFIVRGITTFHVIVLYRDKNMSDSSSLRNSKIHAYTTIKSCQDRYTYKNKKENIATNLWCSAHDITSVKRIQYSLLQIFSHKFMFTSSKTCPLYFFIPPRSFDIKAKLTNRGSKESLQVIKQTLPTIATASYAFAIIRGEKSLLALSSNILNTIV